VRAFQGSAGSKKMPMLDWEGQRLGLTLEFMSPKMVNLLVPWQFQLIIFSLQESAAKCSRLSRSQLPRQRSKITVITNISAIQQSSTM